MVDIIWEHCNNCMGQKRHEVIYRNVDKWSEVLDKKIEVCGGNTDELLRCCGCHHVHFRQSNWFSEDEDPETGLPIKHVVHYPPLTSRKKPKWLYPSYIAKNKIFTQVVNGDIENLIDEIYIALQNSAPRLALLGIRALMESIMLDKVGDHGSFKKNLNQFLGSGYISSKQKEILESVLEAGHAAMHRGYKSDSHEVSNLMDITESVIETIYVNQLRTNSIGGNIPKRKKQAIKPLERDA